LLLNIFFVLLQTIDGLLLLYDTKIFSTATMLLFGQIGTDIDGNYFAKELKYLADSGIKDIKILINSVGGSVFDGYSIISVINEISDKVNITSKNVGVAYSMAGVILASCRQRTALNYSTTMIHDPFFNTKKELKASDRSMLDKITLSLNNILVNVTGQTAETITEKMKNETTFTATEALEFGLIDNIEQIKNIKLPKNKFLRMVACADIYNKTTIKTNKMSELNNILDLNVEASASAQVEAVKALKEQITNGIDAINNAKILKAENEVLKTENETLKSKIVNEKAEALVNKAIEAGKIIETAKETWLNHAKVDFENAEKLINSLSFVPNLNKSFEEDKENIQVLANKFDAMSGYEKDKLNKKELAKLEKAWLAVN